MHAFHSIIISKIKQLSYYFLASVMTTAVAQETSYLANFQQMTQNGNSIAPVFSPTDNNLIAFTQSKFQGIYLLHRNSTLRTSSRIDVLTEAQAGFGFSWAGDGKNIVARITQQGQKQVGTIDVLTKQYTDFSGYSGKISLPTVRQNTAFFVNGASAMAVDMSKRRALDIETLNFPVFERNAHITIGDKPIHSEDMQCWLPKISPDGEKLSFECWDGLHLYDIARENSFALGKGTNAQWSQDSRYVIYEKTSDDGHEITSSDIFIANSDGTNVRNLTENTDEIVRRPSFSPDGKQVAVEIDGNIFIADLHLGE
jgi:hypothetical protein